MSKENFYITTPIYYVNDVPHIGHAYTTIAADVLARRHKSGGEKTWFLTGTDEHGQKIQTVAQKKGITPKELCDEVVQNFQRLWGVLNISNDDFIRTTEPRHETVVQEIFRRLMANGDIYKGEYEGWYCVPCETYVPEAQMGEGNTVEFGIVAIAGNVKIIAGGYFLHDGRKGLAMGHTVFNFFA